MSIDNRPFKQVIYLPENKLLKHRCPHGCDVELVVIPYVATAKALGECEHFKYVMLLGNRKPPDKNKPLTREQAKKYISALFYKTMR